VGFDRKRDFRASSSRSVLMGGFSPQEQAARNREGSRGRRWPNSEDLDEDWKKVRTFRACISRDPSSTGLAEENPSFPSCFAAVQGEGENARGAVMS
jgi:hypothetical protein